MKTTIIYANSSEGRSLRDGETVVGIIDDKVGPQLMFRLGTSLYTLGEGGLHCLSLGFGGSIVVRDLKPVKELKVVV